jgi:FeS assembly SUF system regulator
MLALRPGAGYAPFALHGHRNSTGEVLMIRVSRLADYGLLLMTQIARSEGPVLRNAHSLAVESGLPLPTVSKILKELLHSDLLISRRGTKGGYCLARDAREITVAEIIAVFEGEIAMTECSHEVLGLCELEPLCPIRSNMQIISHAVRRALEQVTLSDLVQPLRLITVRDIQGRLLPSLGVTSSKMQ